jgi:hypothetical protein
MNYTMNFKKKISLQCADLTRQLKRLLCCRMAEAKVAAVKMILLHNIQPTGDDDAQASANQGQRYSSVSQSQKRLSANQEHRLIFNFFLICCDTDCVETVHITIALLKNLHQRRTT